MKRNEFLQDAIGYIDDSLIAEATQTKKRTLQRWLPLIAACLCVAICLPIAFGFLGGSRISKFNSLKDPLHIGTVCDGRVTPGPGNTSTLACPNHYSYMAGITVVAEPIELLPDVYYEAGKAVKGTKYRILKMRVTEALYGKNIPEEIYLRFNAKIALDVNEFDRLVIPLRQVGLEDYLLINETQSRAEHFTAIFENKVYYEFEDMWDVLPFKDGQFVTSFCGFSESRGEGAYFRDENREDHITYYAWPGCTLNETIDKLRFIRESELYRNDYENDYFKRELNTPERFFKKSDFDSPEIQDVFEYIAPYENGIFGHTFEYTDEVRAVKYYRMIDGFSANETVSIDLNDRSVGYSKERFTKKELKRIHALGDLIESLDLDSFVPPHAATYNDKSELRVTDRAVMGRYVKIDGEIYAFVEISWLLTGTRKYYDDLYILVEPNGKYRQIDREQLRELLENDPYISRNKYGLSSSVLY